MLRSLNIKVANKILFYLFPSFHNVHIQQPFYTVSKLHYLLSIFLLLLLLFLNEIPWSVELWIEMARKELNSTLLYNSRINPTAIIKLTSLAICDRDYEEKLELQ